MGVRVLFSSDLHGNDEHLERLLHHAEHVEAVDVVVLGGDLGPRGTGFGRDADGMQVLLSHLPKRSDGKIDWTTDEALAYMREGYMSQKEWFTRTLVPMLERCAVPSVCLFGNSDWAGLLPLARAARTREPKEGENAHVRFAEGLDVFTLRTRARDAVTREPLATVDVLSCSLVPVCGHRKKDWERCDTRVLAETAARPGLEFENDAFGFVSTTDGEGVARGAVDVSEEGARLRSIQSALAALIETRVVSRNKNVPPLWVTHAPPFRTVGDACAAGTNVGSVAVRDAIQRWSPRVTLHGHIHESVEMHGGRFCELVPGREDRDKTTLVCSVGNDFKREHPHCLVFDANDPERRVTRVEVKPRRDDDAPFFGKRG